MGYLTVVVSVMPECLNRASSLTISDKGLAAVLDSRHKRAGMTGIYDRILSISVPSRTACSSMRCRSATRSSGVDASR